MTIALADLAFRYGEQDNLRVPKLNDLTGYVQAATVITGDPTIIALAALDATPGIVVETAADTFTKRTLAGTANRLTVTNGDGVAGAPTFDISAAYVGQTSITTLGTIATGTWAGTVIAADHGGTGQTSYAVGDLLYASTTSALSKLADIATGNVLLSGGVGVAPAWGKVDLTAAVTGDLPLANLAQGTARSVLGVTGNATADYAPIQGTASQFLGINAAGTALAFQTMSGDATLSAGALTIANNAVTFAKIVAASAASMVGATAAGNFAELTPTSARTVMGVTATGGDTTYAFRANNLSDLANASTARTNLGLGTGNSPSFTGLTITSGGIISTSTGSTIIFQGSSGGSTASFGLRIYDTDNSHTVRIASGSDLTANRTFLLATGDVNNRTLDVSASDVTISVAGAALIDDADATAQRVTLGLGTLATQSGTFSGTSSGTNTGDQTSVSGNAGTATILATPRAIYGNNFDGSAALTQVIASTYGGTGNGFTKFTGPTTSEKTFTLPNSSETLLYSGGALGTPSSGTLTNATGLPIAGLVASTSTAVGVGSIEIGHASDTTIARSGAGDITIEGNAVYRAGGTDVAVADGGTGRSTSTTAYALIAAGTTATGAHQTLAAGATTEVLVGGGASALPVWTTATGTGAPVRAGSPTFTGTATFAALSVTDTSTYAYLNINGGATQGGGLRTARNGTAHTFFGDTASALGSGTGLILYTYGADPILFYPNGTLAATVDGTGLDVVGLSRCDSFRIDAAPSVSVAAPSTHKLAISCNGTTYYLLLSNV